MAEVPSDPRMRLVLIVAFALGAAFIAGTLGISPPIVTMLTGSAALVLFGLLALTTREPLVLRLLFAVFALWVGGALFLELVGVSTIPGVDLQAVFR